MALFCVHFNGFEKFYTSIEMGAVQKVICRLKIIRKIRGIFRAYTSDDSKKLHFEDKLK